MSEKFIYGVGTEDVTLEQVQQYHYQLVQAEGGKECQCETCQPKENAKEG
jgi:hypothetical protein